MLALERDLVGAVAVVVVRIAVHHVRFRAGEGIGTGVRSITYQIGNTRWARFDGRGRMGRWARVEQSPLGTKGTLWETPVVD